MTSPLSEGLNNNIRKQLVLVFINYLLNNYIPQDFIFLKALFHTVIVKFPAMEKHNTSSTLHRNSLMTPPHRHLVFSSSNREL